MIDLDLLYTPAHELARKINAKLLSPVELMEQSLARIDEVNQTLNCFCFVFHDEAMALARQSEKTVMSGQQTGPAHGLPFGVKDVTPVAGKTMTRGSKMYEHYVPDRDAIIVERFKNAGAIIIGKTTTPEFAYSSFTHSPLWGRTSNPWDVARTPGGSSGGSATAVATGCVPLAEGTDMGGSVRIPASFCNLVGLKPSLGRIPMDILPTVFDNISHFGPLARNITDANLFMNIAGGPDERDIMSLPDKLRFPLPGDQDVKGMKLALSLDLGFYSVNPEVEQALLDATDHLRQLGAIVEPVELGWNSTYSDIWHDIWGVYLDACFTQDLDHWRDQMDPDVVSLIERGRSIDAVTYKKFEVKRTEQWHLLCNVFDRYDALLTPTMAQPAPLHKQTDKDFTGFTEDGKFMGLDMTCVFNNVGQCPALSVPAGFTRAGLPIGAQIVGHRFADLAVMKLGAALESTLDLCHRRPPEYAA
ncbi:MAG: amidase [Candidatus Tectomicrobia bacterium]|nr:amidase [Candidatus Tectomicrobia bacterium]